MKKRVAKKRFKKSEINFKRELRRLNKKKVDVPSYRIVDDSPYRKEK